MNTEDKELITAIAGRVMGWTVTEKPVEANDTGETLFFLDGDKPVKAVPYEHSADLRAHGACNHGYKWARWNPIADANDREEVIGAIKAAGGRVTINYDEGFVSVFDIEMRMGKSRNDNIGLAFCQAALHWVWERQDDEDNLNEMLGALSFFMVGLWPEGSKYAAIDSNGNVYAYPSRPVIHQSGRYWIQTEPGSTILQVGWLAIKPGTPWDKLIIERPPAEAGPEAREIFTLSDVVI